MLKMLTTNILLAATAATTSASMLFVSSYSGNVTTLALSGSAGNMTLDATSATSGCSISPSWLTLDPKHRILYCIDEGNITTGEGPGSLSTFYIGAKGVLSQVAKEATLGGPVNGVLYGKSPNRDIALAHYGAGAISSFHTTVNGTISPLQNITFNLTQPGPVADRQAAPHPHEAILDPTGQYILVPDLGADLVRVFCFDEGSLYEHDPLKVLPGSGPRHAAFWTPGQNASEGTYLYVVTELTSTVTGYKVDYLPQGGLGFTQVYNTTSLGGSPVPNTTYASEVAVSPDKRFLIVSNRNDSSFQIENFDPTNSTQEVSDSISTFAINPNATLTHVQLSPAGGRYPRQFQLNRAGDVLAVGLQLSSRVVLISRDVSTGLLGEPVAATEVDGQVTCVTWNENKL